MKYCMHCGHEIDIDAKSCPNCFNEIKDDIFNPKIKCIKCGSMDVECTILEKRKSNIDFEENLYICNNCNKKFKDKNRLGKSFNNNPQIILNQVEKKIISFLIYTLIFIVVFLKLMANSKLSDDKKYEEVSNWTRIDCTGLQTASSDYIYDNVISHKEQMKETYLNKNFIFTGKIYLLELDKKMPYIRIEETTTSPEYYLNLLEVDRARNYKVGDNITVCGTITKIGGLYSTIKVENVTIIE